ncbi:hypothetical protein SSE37_21270 [Sagittula stellata E-37]|uniref:Uncharacterized protein n=1 Tax=Sagittula stellata (strain ATCC 700073 / DSM 11524 / E-37) TaxID=388399 RepID=A3K5I2_SAGS3|nr:hypothetical protein SSE37_21270 [Sagittula stellata E-37]
MLALGTPAPSAKGRFGGSLGAMRGDGNQFDPSPMSRKEKDGPEAVHR